MARLRLPNSIKPCYTEGTERRHGGSRRPRGVGNSFMQTNADIDEAPGFHHVVRSVDSVSELGVLCVLPFGSSAREHLKTTDEHGWTRIKNRFPNKAVI